MARIVSVLSFLLVLMVTLIGVIFALRNDQIVSVDFFVTEISSASLGVWLLGSLILGLILGFLFSIPAQLFLSGSNKIKDRKLLATESKLTSLKRTTAKG